MGLGVFGMFTSVEPLPECFGISLGQVCVHLFVTEQRQINRGTRVSFSHLDEPRSFVNILLGCREELGATRDNDAAKFLGSRKDIQHPSLNV